jgi:pyridoxal phosphate enzyme (YggS family)
MSPLQKIIADIEHARLSVSPHHIVKLVAVSKNVDSGAVEALYNQGQRAFGENRVQDMKTKVDYLVDLPLEWHFIGRLQTNKINALLDLSPSLIHSIDSLELAHAINERAKVKNKKVDILLQINAAREETKAGVMVENALEVYEQIAKECDCLALQGVMTIGAHTDETKVITKSFEATRKIFDDLAHFSPTVCSMGMSGDYKEAIKCGSTMVRIGSALFDD